MTESNSDNIEPNSANEEQSFEGEGNPEIEDANAPSSQNDEALADDDSAQLGQDARTLAKADSENDGVETPEANARHEAVLAEAAGDADMISEEEIEDKVGQGRDWASRTAASQAQKVAVELKHVEEEVRSVLDDRDSRRKRKLNGSRRWRELEEDILDWHFTGRFEESTLKHLQQLIAKRHLLFRRLSYLGGTRPTWNS